MHTFFTNLMAGLLFIHTVFGCCWHHAHSYAPPEHAAIHKASHCCHHHEHSAGSKHDETPCQDRLECHGTCTYVAPQKVQIDSPVATASFELAAVLATNADGLIAPEVPHGWELLPNATQPPLRIHLLHQILLI